MYYSISKACFANKLENSRWGPVSLILQSNSVITTCINVELHWFRVHKPRGALYLEFRAKDCVSINGPSLEAFRGRISALKQPLYYSAKEWSTEGRERGE